MRARAEMKGQDVSGTATFTEYEFGAQKLVKVELELSGSPEKLKVGLHAVHIHEKPCCDDDPSFKCAGGHFDPGPAGNPDPDVNHPYHAGDLPNILIDEEGFGVLEAVHFNSGRHIADGSRQYRPVSRRRKRLRHLRRPQTCLWKYQKGLKLKPDTFYRQISRTILAELHGVHVFFNCVISRNSSFSFLIGSFNVSFAHKS